MQMIPSVQVTQAVAVSPTLQTIRELSTVSAALCGGSFALLLATAVSNYLMRAATVETADWLTFFGQFEMPALPILLMLALLATRNRAMATLVAVAGASLYIFLWMVAAF